MIGAIIGGEGLSSSSSIYLTQQPGIQDLSTASSPTGGESAGGPAQSTATISGPGRLLSSLEQLQAQNPTEFTQVVSQIASQLQTAAQQTRGAQSSLLSNLAARFQNVAQTGNLAQLQPQQHHHHHGSHGAYSQSGQASPQDLTALGQPDSSSPSSSSLQQLFTTISNEVNAALGTSAGPQQ